MTKQYFGNDFETQHSLFKAAGGKFHVLAEKGRMVTAAYIKRGGDMNEVAVAHCNPNDEADETIGKAIALQHFVNGNTVKVRGFRNAHSNNLVIHGFCQQVI